MYSEVLQITRQQPKHKNGQETRDQRCPLNLQRLHKVAQKVKYKHFALIICPVVVLSVKTDPHGMIYFAEIT